MAWTKLANRLSGLPHILAGPILRQVTSRSVTVWVALRTSAKVTLNVQDDKKNKIFSGNRLTTSVGKFLHIVAVTAVPINDGTTLTEGIIYQYDLVFDFTGGLSMTLATAAGSVSLAYSPLTLPSFAYAPKDPNSVRIMHGSCRMPHANGSDALPQLDDLIAQAAGNAFLRPHQLLLTGDQIYADDVADSLLVMLTDASDTLLGWQEVLPIASSSGGPKKGNELTPYMRPPILKAAAFTSDDLLSHLMTLGEYLAMYLFVWSDVLWSPSIPTVDDILDEMRRVVGSTGDVEEPGAGKGAGAEKFDFGDKLRARKKAVNDDIKSIDAFRKALPKVRRILANIPIAMICDDHEVTDDWNMTLGFCRGVYGNALGRRVVQNALVAYALCQHWGNAPEQFDDSGQAPAGLSILRLLESGDATTYEQNSPGLQTRVGVHDVAALKKSPDNGVFHDQNKFLTINGKTVCADSLTYNYTVEMDAYQVIVTDTRTWRSYPDGDNSTPHLIPKTQFKPQITDTPPLNDRVLLVVLTTNAPSVQPIRSATKHSYLTTKFGDSDHPDIYDSWEVPSTVFDRLLARLTDKLPKDTSGALHGKVILLSGDVHHSFASRLIYRARKRFEDTQPQAANVVFAQVVASSLKKQNGNTLGLHREGYKYGPTGTAWLIPKHLPEGYVGFNLPNGTLVSERFMSAGIPNQGTWLSVTLDAPSIELKNFGDDPDPKANRLIKTPDFRYRLDYLIASSENIQGSLPPVPPLPAGASAADRKKAADAYNVASGNYRTYNKTNSSTQEIVGVNNLGEITFEWGAGDNKRVTHTLRWASDAIHQTLRTSYSVSLDPNDPNFTDIKALNE